MRKLFAITAFILLNPFLRAQSLDIKWSDRFVYDNKLDGFFNSFEGSNDQYIYARFSNFTFKGKKRNKKVKLIAFDKNTMKKLAEAPLKGYGSETSDFIYYNTFVFKKVVYVIWEKETKKKREFFAQSFDEKLVRANKLAKIYEVSTEKSNNENVTILSNAKASKLVIFKELPFTKDDENLRIEFKVLNSDLSFDASHQVTLPIQLDRKRRKSKNLKVNYKLGDDGNLYVTDLIKMDDEAKRNLRRRESSIYTYFGQINADNGELKDYSVKFEGKNTFKVSYIVDKGKIKLYGFFCDLDKDIKGVDTHGIFYVCISNSTFSIETTHFEYFDKKFLDELYSKDREDQKHGKGIFKSKRAKQSDDESIDDSYVIEQTISDEKSLVLFCSIMRNYSYQTCTTSNGVTSCVTHYRCDKRNVTAFKLDKDGKIRWARNMDRQITYDRWDVYDIRAVKDNYNYYVLYGSARDIDGKRKRRDSYNKLEYAVFSSADGSFKKAECLVNKEKVKKKERKYVTIMQISTFDNKMYTQCTRVRRKPAVYFSLLFPPAFFVLMVNGNLYKGTGYLATLASSGQ